MRSQEENRRLTTILMADVVGYSRMMAADEAGTLAQLKANRKEIILLKETEYCGRTVKLMGDGALMEFSSVSDAVRFAIDIQRSMIMRNQDIPIDQQICYRIGINIGEIIVDGDDIYGGGINICSRLESICEPNGIFLSEGAYRQVESTTSVEFKALGRKKLKNIPEPISIYKVLLDTEKPTIVNEESVRNNLWKKILGGILLAIVVCFLAYAMFYPHSQPLTDSGTPVAASKNEVETDTTATDLKKPSIAVLPFANLSDDREQEYFSDGITNDIITDLSQLSNLLVIASNSVFVYKNTPVKVQQVATELGVTHVLEGSVQKSGLRVRINAQLIDAASGHHLWAERFDRDLIDIFVLQDEVSKKIVEALAIELTSDEKQRLETSQQADPGAYDMLLRGLEQLRRFTRDTNIEAREYFQRAIDADPGFARAYADVALTHSLDIQFGWEKATAEKFAVAFEYADKALALDDTLVQVHFAASMLYLLNKQYEKAIESSKRSISLNPNYADGYAQKSQLLIYAGKPKEALDKIHKAMELNPRHSFFYTWIEGRAHQQLGHLEKAEKLFLDVIERNAQFPGAHLTLAALYSNQGRIEDAQWEAAEVLNLRPDFSLGKEAESIPYQKQEHLEFYINGLRKAGLPE